jgi:hypothetical protein
MTILSDFESGMCCLIDANWAFSNIKSLSKFFDLQLNGFLPFSPYFEAQFLFDKK